MLIKESAGAGYVFDVIQIYLPGGNFGYNLDREVTAIYETAILCDSSPTILIICTSELPVDLIYVQCPINLADLLQKTEVMDSYAIGS